MNLRQTLTYVYEGATTSVVQLGTRALYRALVMYYTAKEWAKARTVADMALESKKLRNPVNRLVEFYVSHVMPGDLPDALPIEFEGENPKAEQVMEAIHRIWRWSNWATRKQYAVRLFCLTGDWILKVASAAVDGADEPNRVYLQIIEPKNVTDLEVDHFGNVTYIRLDIPAVRRYRDRDPENYVHTETWDLEGMRIWEHQKGETETLSQLETPKEKKTLEEAGVPGFIPFVHAKFRDIGETRGMNVFLAHIEKIDEADLFATRLHQMVTRGKDPIWAVESNARDLEGRQLPPPRVATTDGTVTGTTVDLTGEKLVTVNGKLQCLVPDLPYAAMNEILRDLMGELQKDMPELQAYEIMGHHKQVATETIRLMLAPAFERVIEARGNAERALARADMIALTMAQSLGLEGFSAAEIGTYEDGSFAHTFAKRDPWPLGEQETANLDKIRAETDGLKQGVGWPFETILAERGYSQEERADIIAKAATEKAKRRTMADVVMDRAAQRRFDQGGE